MGFFSALKRLFFATESVAKSAVDQAESVLHEKGVEVSHSVNNTAQKVWSAAEGLKEKGAELKEKISENPTVKNIIEATESAGEKLIERGEDLLEKAAVLSEETGKKVIEVSDLAWEKISEKSESLVEKARQVSNELTEKFEEAVSKAEAFVEEDSRIDSEVKEGSTKSSLLEDTEGFFQKAEVFLSGEGDNKGSKVSETIILTETEIVERSPSRVAGQDDHDGDGNEQIDDAKTEGSETDSGITP